jgi:hypothetical protein
MGVSVLSLDGTGGLEILAGAPGGDPHQSNTIGTFYEYRLDGAALTNIGTVTAASVTPPGTSIYDFGDYALHQ